MFLSLVLGLFWNYSIMIAIVGDIWEGFSSLSVRMVRLTIYKVRFTRLIKVLLINLCRTIRVMPKSRMLRLMRKIFSWN